MSVQEGEDDVNEEVPIHDDEPVQDKGKKQVPLVRHLSRRSA